MFPRISVECWGFPAILSWIHSLSRRQRERTGLPYWIWCCRYITWFCHRIDDWGRIGNPVYDIKSTGRWQCKEIFCKCDFVYPHNQHSICPVWHFSPDTVMHMMGADAGITQLGRTYTRIFLLFTPFLWWIMCFLRLSATTMLRPSPWLERWWEVFPMLSLTMCLCFRWGWDWQEQHLPQQPLRSSAY